MPRRELRYPHQVHDWLSLWGKTLRSQNKEGTMILIGSAAILLHAYGHGIQEGFLDGSMDVDPITSDESLAMLCYDSQIGSAFELENGWHVNLMPDLVLQEFEKSWRERATTLHYEELTVTIPSVEDLIKPKLKRGEPRDLRHRDYAVRHRLFEGGECK